MRRRHRNVQQQGLPELHQAKRRVLDRLPSKQSRRSYRSAIDDFIRWYCATPRLGFDKSAVSAYVAALKDRGLASSTINGRLVAIRGLASVCHEGGLIGADSLSGMMQMAGVRQLGTRTGHWLSAEQARVLIRTPDRQSRRGKRDGAILALLLGCGLRRSELVYLDVNHFRFRDGRWLIVDLVGKGQRIRDCARPILGQGSYRRLDRRSSTN